MHNPETIVHVGNVVLGNECLKQLECLQQGGNAGIHELTTMLLNAIMLLSLPTDGELISERILAKRAGIIQDLALAIDYIEDLGIPVKSKHS
jgi:hypothetical protein